MSEIVKNILAGTIYDKLVAIDLFCGCGGFSLGLVNACKEMGIDLELTAFNHWQIAVDTHSHNIVEADHRNVDLVGANPLKLMGGRRRIHLALAAPECTHNSRARGGKPRDDQKRAQPFTLLDWGDKHYIDMILMENVPEMRTWGPLGYDGQPIASLKGTLYIQFLENLKALGYPNPQEVILKAADYGDATSRERLFIVAQRARSRSKFKWPSPTHTDKPEPTMFGPALKRYRTAYDIIDWEDKGKSIFTRPKPLVDNTMVRIFSGLLKYSGLPFLTKHYKGSFTADLKQPLPTVTASYEHFGLCSPYIVIFRNHATTQPVDLPLRTLTTSGANFGLCSPAPYIVGAGGPSGAGEPKPVTEPVSTILARNHKALVCPYLLSVRGGKDGYTRTSDVFAPLPALTTAPAMALVEPQLPMPENALFGVLWPRCLLPYLVAATAKGKKREVIKDAAALDPYLIHFYGERPGQEGRTRPVTEPVATIACQNRIGLCRPVLVKYYRTGTSVPVDVPLDTITTKARFGLAVPEIDERQLAVEGYAELDILFRMLKTGELAAAHSLPKTYVIFGTEEEKKKQIGNMVPVGLGTALCLSAVGALAARLANRRRRRRSRK